MDFQALVFVGAVAGISNTKSAKRRKPWKLHVNLLIITQNKIQFVALLVYIITIIILYFRTV